MGLMKLGNHAGPDLFDVFIRQKVYLKYAVRFLDAEQIDEVDVTKIPGLAASHNVTKSVTLCRISTAFPVAAIQTFSRKIPRFQ